ncbi:MAG: YlbF family regulator [Bacilli bacterium]|nr:YlbF family regulator [Bacilli bacterium]
MNEEILLSANKLKEALKNDERIIALNAIEKKMMESEEVMALSYQKDVAADKYNDMLRIYKENSEEVTSSLKELAEAKKKLEEHPLVREYLKAYQKVRLLYEEINQTLFSSLNNDFCGE